MFAAGFVEATAISKQLPRLCGLLATRPVSRVVVANLSAVSVYCCACRSDSTRSRQRCQVSSCVPDSFRAECSASSPLILNRAQRRGGSSLPGVFTGRHACIVVGKACGGSARWPAFASLCIFAEAIQQQSCCQVSSCALDSLTGLAPAVSSLAPAVSGVFVATSLLASVTQSCSKVVRTGCKRDSWRSCAVFTPAMFYRLVSTQKRLWSQQQ